METILSCAGFFLILIFLSEGFKPGLERLKFLLRQQPRLKYVVYPLGALLGLGAAALIIHTLATFAATRFSYD